jgi:hypothetical protein
MDTIPIIAHWPKHPYRGLDFYRETDELLFHERETDVRECADIILGFGVKILLLQGSSGSGKSSFLRAGLIPHLKRETRRNFFLNHRDAVIRCTSDPLPEIARSLIGALDNRKIFAESVGQAGEWDGETLVEAALRREVCGVLQRAMAASRERLAEVVVDALVKVCSDLPGKLVLVLDQAEEVLTRTPGETAGDEAAAAFFHFLEDVYLRNVDARLVVALRTEYYGRFRDELRISDDRLGKRPRSGGIDSYLLGPLRETNTLARVVEAPTLACDDAGVAVYGFAFEPALIEKIVDDLVQEFPHAAITPALQVVCASLYERLTLKNRTITCGDYDTLKRIRGIVRSYVERGISAAAPRTKAETDQWHLLLHSLVSRQGGGTVVSLTEPLEELTRRAQNLGIGGDIEAALLKLTGGAAPLLRGEPADGPRFFSLKHDVLAVVLSRWFHEHSARLKAKKEEALKRRLMLSIGVPVILAIVLGAAFFGYDRGQEALKEKTRAVQITNRHAIRAPTGDFRRSLLLTLANLDATAQPSGIYERITSGNDSVRAEALTALREVLPRTPWFAGRFGAAGLDPAEGRVALLQRDQTALLTLSVPSEDGERADPKLKDYNLPTRAARQSMLHPAAGFVSGLGPVALVDGYAYFWNNRGDRQECDLEASLPQSIASGSWIRAEFVAGRLQLSTTVRHGLLSNLLILRLAASDLRSCSSAIATAEPLRVTERTSSQPVPVFADAPDASHLFEYLEETSERPPNELAANLPTDPSLGETRKLLELDAVMSPADRQSAPMRIAVGQVAPERGIPERLHYTLAFGVNAQATVFKFDGPDFYVYDLADSRLDNRPNHVVVPPRHVAVATNLPDNAWRLRPGRLPWLYPPLAAVKVLQHWRVAWLAESGVWAVESSDRDPGTARPMLDAPLIGEPDGMKLQFTPDGEFLVLTAAQGPRAPISVRIWDLRPSWRTWIEAPTTTEQELRQVACRIVRADGLGGAIDDTELDLFQINRAHREPCPEPKGTNG